MMSHIRRSIKPTLKDVCQIRLLVDHFKKISDQDLKQVHQRLILRWLTRKPKQLKALTTEAVALIAEAFRRSLGVELYDVQLLAGLVVSTGRIAEMQTGEGKTFVTAIPAYVHSLSQQGVHIATTNAYLAARDHAEILPVFERLGVSVGLLPEEICEHGTREAYQRDVTYGTGYQFGFDFLRDQLSRQASPLHALGGTLRSQINGKPGIQLKQRGWNHVVIDEIDSVLIDEALTPLVLSGPAQANEDLQAYSLAQQIVMSLQPETDFVLEPDQGQIHLNAETVKRTAASLKNVRLARPWRMYLQHALRANHFLQRDEHYVVRDDQVALVDQNTGRIFADRKWRSGLHQAVQAKERVSISVSESSLAQITRQRYFQGYRSLCGLTGTVTGSEQEFQNTYGLECVKIPTHRVSLRQRLPHQIFSSQAVQIEYLLKDVLRRQNDSQPILIGTQSIKQTKLINEMLDQKKRRHTVLNGMQDASEAEIIAQAGQPGQVTVATNMAGRGTDIKLTEAVIKRGGLHVIGVGLNFSRRIDRQLIGRSGRQGNPGSAQFFISAEDELLRKHHPELAERIRQHSSPDGVCQRDFSKELEQLQMTVEQLQMTQRATMLKRDQWVNSMRKVFFSKRT